MEANKDDIAVEKETAVNDAIDLDMDKDTIERRRFTLFDANDLQFLLKWAKTETADPEDFHSHLSEPEISISGTVRYRRNKKEHLRQGKDLVAKLICMVQEISADHHEEEQLFQIALDSLNLEIRRRNARKFIESNRQCGQLKKVWMSRGLPVDRESLQSAAASKEAFDMRSVSESLPPKPHTGDDEFERKATKITREFISMYSQKMRDLLSVEMVSGPDPNTPELNNNLPSCSSEVRQPDTLADTVKKMCRDSKNIRLYSFRPLKRTQIDPVSDISEGMDVSEIKEASSVQNKDEQDKAPIMTRKRPRNLSGVIEKLNQFFSHSEESRRQAMLKKLSHL